MKDKQRFWIDEVFPSSGLTGRGYQIVTGGYKLYGAEGAEDRWFFNFNIELPTSMFTNGTIIYQYLTYQDADQNEANTGAVACKIQVGDLSKTSVDQWKGVTNLNSNSTAIIGKTWDKQLKKTKMREPDYYARWYDDAVFLSKSSSRESGDFTQQQCEVEVKLPADANVDTINMDLAMGARIYSNNDDQNFTALPQYEFDWYNSPMEYSAELEEVPTYENEQVQVAESADFTISADDVFSDKISQLATTRAQASIAIEVDGPASAVSRQTTTYSAS